LSTTKLLLELLDPMLWSQQRFATGCAWHFNAIELRMVRARRITSASPPCFLALLRAKMVLDLQAGFASIFGKFLAAMRANNHYWLGCTSAVEVAGVRAVFVTALLFVTFGCCELIAATYAGMCRSTMLAIALLRAKNTAIRYVCLELFSASYADMPLLWFLTFANARAGANLAIATNPRLKRFAASWTDFSFSVLTICLSHAGLRTIFLESVFANKFRSALSANALIGNHKKSPVGTDRQLIEGARIPTRDIANTIRFCPAGQTSRAFDACSIPQITGGALSHFA
jgi:hypothetical protein